jgi:hypothetical protein
LCSKKMFHAVRRLLIRVQRATSALISSSCCWPGCAPNMACHCHTSGTAAAPSCSRTGHRMSAGSHHSMQGSHGRVGRMHSGGRSCCSS